MLTSLTSTLLLAACALAVPSKKAPSLKVALTSPTQAVDSIDDVTIVASVTNTGPEEIKFVKYGSVLDSDSPTRSFKVTKDGTEVAFQGIKMSVDMEKLTPDEFISIPAGETVTVKHQIAALYDFAAVGTGDFTFEPVSRFRVIEGSAPEVEASVVKVNVNHDVATRTIPEKRAVTSCSNASQSSFISASYTEGKSLASRAVSYINSNGRNSLFTAYFGTNSASTITGVFSRVANESGGRTLSCSDPYGVCGGGVIAYTLTSTTNIYYCSIFYQEVTSSRLCSGTTVASRNVRGGTTLHELTHATSGTDDVTYGCSQDQGLSNSNKAINADNYNCFATQVYANTAC